MSRNQVRYDAETGASVVVSDVPDMEGVALAAELAA